MLTVPSHTPCRPVRTIGRCCTASCGAPGVRIRLGVTVRDVQADPAVPGGPRVMLTCGEVLYADLIVGADGVKSTLQKTVTDLDDRPTTTYDAAYRAVISTDLMLEDPELRPL
jgi:salicylate hydroxylase